MKEQLISFETAKLAKEKGFHEWCGNCYDEIKPHELVEGHLSGHIAAPPPIPITKMVKGGESGIC